MANTVAAKPQTLIPKQGIRRVLHNFKRDWMLWTLVVIPVVYIFIFNYVPIYGIQISFKEYSPRKGIMGSDWTGLENFAKFFDYYAWPDLVWNTLALSLMRFFLGDPLTIFAALAIHVYQGKRLKKLTQNITYMPNFISLVIMIGILNTILNPVSGLLGAVYRLFGIFGADDIRTSKEAFRWVYWLSGEWQGLGWSTILYVSTLSGVPDELHEAAKIDGASRWRRIWAIDLPTILPTIGLLYIMGAANFLNVGHQKVYLMQRATNLEVSEIISTYVYKEGIRSGNQSFGSAVGLFQSMIGLVLTIFTNWLASTLSEGEIALF